MLGFIFGFNARMGRLNFVLCSVVLGATAAAGTFVIFSYTIQQMMKAAHPSAGAAMTWPLYAVVGVFMVISCILQSMRIRDIGWNPVWVLPAWIALFIADKVIAAKFPAWAIGHDHYAAGTVAGSLLNTALFALLIFMPGTEPDEPAPVRFDDYPAPDQPPRHELPRYEPPVPPVTRIAPATRPEFGRRQAGTVG
jgi:uncharacterized membrane protein YhaH (DUF805 family)